MGLSLFSHIGAMGPVWENTKRGWCGVLVCRVARFYHWLSSASVNSLTSRSRNGTRVSNSFNRSHTASIRSIDHGAAINSCLRSAATRAASAVTRASYASRCALRSTLAAASVSNRVRTLSGITIPAAKEARRNFRASFVSVWRMGMVPWNESHPREVDLVVSLFDQKGGFGVGRERRRRQCGYLCVLSLVLDSMCVKSGHLCSLDNALVCVRSVWM